MSPVQCRNARDLLNWSILDLADKADLSIETISAFEGGQDECTESVTETIRCALEDAGIIFTENKIGLS